MPKSEITTKHYLREAGMILPTIYYKKTLPTVISMISIAAMTLLIYAGISSAAAVKQKTFASAEEAVKALITAARNDDDSAILEIFGPDGKDLIFSGDKVADKQRRKNFLAVYDEQNKLVPEGDSMILVIGKNEFPYPIPLVKKGKTWLFDSKKGKEEVLNRRIGENELYTIQTVLAVVDAQREYAMIDHDGDGLREYAEKFASDTSKQNGLYWETKEGEAPSPLGELLVKAKAEGYSKQGSQGNPVPYHGYFYKILKAQGKNAPGGAYDYIINGNMIGGFALVAWPAKYGNSGVMTFMVNHDGVVYQKNLGKDTEKIAKAITKYDPDKTWGKAQ
jgi:type II secretory pathway pseudopilin PulG